MFYICKKVGDKYGILDTEDGVIELHTLEQICKFARKVKIYGVEFIGTTLVIRVVQPSAFEPLSEACYDVDFLNSKKAAVQATKFNFTEKAPFYKMFSSVFNDLNIDMLHQCPENLLILSFKSWIRDRNMLAFTLASDTELISDVEVPDKVKDNVAERIRAIYDNSTYKNYSMLKFSYYRILTSSDSSNKKGNSSLYIGSRSPFIYVSCSVTDKDYIKSQLIALVNDKDAKDKVEHQHISFNFMNLTLEAFNYYHCYYYRVLYNYNGLVICLYCGRASHLFKVKDNYGTYCWTIYEVISRLD